MRTRTPKETAILCGAGVVALALLMIPFETGPGAVRGRNSDVVLGLIVGGVLALAMILWYRHPRSGGRVHVELAAAEQYRRLAEEYRRLADLAITAQEHTDLKLGEVSAQLDYLREQNESLQKILKEVE
jgi:phosphodiesterase/alkaline phosphatase D-like protein